MVIIRSGTASSILCAKCNETIRVRESDGAWIHTEDNQRLRITRNEIGDPTGYHLARPKGNERERH